MIRPIVLWGAEVLEKTSEPIKNITDAEIKLVEDMIETMYKAPGVGLAAPQVGVSKRIMVTDATGGEKKDHLFTMLNPEIVSAEGEQFEEEGSFCAALILKEKKSSSKAPTCWRVPSLTRWIIWTVNFSWTT